MRRWFAVGAVAQMLALPAAAAADTSVGFRVDPASPAPMQDGALRVTAAPGTSASGSFYVTNSGTSRADLQVFSADGLTGTTTGVVYGDGSARGDGAWLAPDRASAVVAPKSEQLMTFVVRVPASVIPGDHVAGVVLQQRKRGGAVSQVVRNVVPVVVDVPGGAGPQIRLQKMKLDTLPGTTAPAVTIGLRNDGTRMCRPRLSVALTGGRETGQPVVRQLDTVLPGDDVAYPMPWPRAPAPGTYEIAVVATGCGVTQRDTVTATTSPEADEVTTTTPAKTRPARTPRTELSDPSPSRRPGAPVDAGPGGLSNQINVTPVPAPSGDPSGAGSQRPPAGGATRQDDTGVVDKVRDLLREHGTDVLERASLPLAILMMLGIAVVAQETLDRRDPKLALAPVHRDPDLPFDHDPVGRIEHPPTLYPTDPRPGGEDRYQA